MRFTRPERTSLIISMTLAETFLLLLFVVWYGYTSILGNLDSNARIKEQLERFIKENKQLKNEINQTQEQIAALKRRLDLWHRITGFDNPPSISELTEWRKEACRSHPKCSNDNVLIHAYVCKGKQWIVLETESPELKQWIGDAGYNLPPIGVPITNPERIQAFLSMIQDYYTAKKKEDDECRFDYYLTYESKEDYYDGRELFEHYFYPARLQQFNKK
jgi:hypothetical protein